MTNKPDSSEALTIEELNLEQVAALCDSNGQQVGPFFKKDPNPKYVTQGGVLYAFGQLRDGTWGYYELPKGTAAFGGPQETLCDKFEDIDGKPHLRVPAKGEKEALNDARGTKYTGIAHKSIQHDHDTPLESRGTVYHVTDEDDEEGYYLDEKLCGKKRGMAPKSELVPAGDDVYLVQSDKEGYIIRVVDIDTGDFVFVDEWKGKEPKLKKCIEVKFVQIGREWYTLKSFHDKEGKKRDEQWLRSKKGEVVYEGLSVRVGNWFDGKRGPFVRTYDETGRMIIVDRRKRMHYIKDSDKVSSEATDGPAGEGVHEIGNETLLKLFLCKEDPNPAIENDDTEVVYRREDQTDAFRGAHDEEVPSVEGRPNTITINRITGKLFKNRATKAIYWVGSNGTDMFGRDHWDDLETIGWKYGPDGMRLQGEGATILKHFKDIGRGHTVLDYQCNAYFKRPDVSEPESDYHINIRDFWVLSYEGKHMLVAEAEDPISKVKNFFSNLWSHPFSPRKWFAVPSTYYTLDGKKADSIDALKALLGAPNDAELVKAKGFEDTVVTSSNPRDTRVDLRIVDPAAGADPRVLEAIAEAQAKAASSGGEPAEGRTTMGEMLLSDEDQGSEGTEGQEE